jgi:hypothetical protein
MNGKYFLLGATLAACLLAVRTWAQDAAATQPGPAVVNIHMKQALAEDVFDELAKQGGIKFSTNGGNLWEQDAMQSGIDIDLTNRSFWSATLECCDLWNLSIQPNYNNNGAGRRVMLQQLGPRRRQGKLPVCESQGFVVQAVAFNRQQTVNYTSPDNNQNYCSVQLTVYVDPSIHLQSLNQTVKADEAVDDGGHSMLPDANNNMFYGGGQAASLIYNCNVPLKYPDNAGKKIADLKCTLQMRGSDKAETMTVDKPLTADESTKSFGALSITFQSLKKTGGGNYELKLSVSRDDPNGGGNDWNLLQNGQLTDEKGRLFSYAGGGGGGNDGNGNASYTINYNSFNGGETAHGEPAKWAIELPANAHTIKVPLEFKDLALP